MITVDRGTATPAFDQIREQIADLVRVGGLRPGQRLPSIRQLAADLAIAPGTVARAYSELELAGLIRTTRTGTTVREGRATAQTIRRSAADFAQEALAAGLSIDDAIAAVRACWAG